MKKILSLLLALAMVFAMAAGAFADNDDGGEILVGIASDLDSSLDPHVSSSLAATREVLFNVYEGLVKPNTRGELVPALAKSYTVSENGDEYTFTLRQGVTFHDGRPVTAEDVVYSLSRAAGLETGEPLMSTLAGIRAVEAVDERTVKVTLAAPDTEFIACMTAAIIPAGSDPADGIIGTGPFKFVSRSVQENIVLERYDDYWGQKALCPRVVFKVIEDGQTMVMSLQSGAIDLAAHLEASQVAALEGLTVAEGSMNLVQALYLNNARFPFDDIRVRQALCYAIDHQEVIDLAADGHGFPLGSSMYPAFGKYFDESLTDFYHKDIDRAVSLLAEAGYDESHPLRFTIDVVESYTPHVSTAQVVVDMLRRTGVVEAEIRQMENSAWYADVYQGRNFQATLHAMDASTLTASALLARFVSDSPKNFIGFDSADYDATYADAVTTTNDDLQTALFITCEALLTEAAANVYIQDLADFVVMQPDIEGYRFYPLYVMDLSAVHRVG